MEFKSINRAVLEFFENAFWDLPEDFQDVVSSFMIHFILFVCDIEPLERQIIFGYYYGGDLSHRAFLIYFETHRRFIKWICIIEKVYLYRVHFWIGDYNIIEFIIIYKSECHDFLSFKGLFIDWIRGI